MYIIQKNIFIFRIWGKSIDVSLLFSMVEVSWIENLYSFCFGLVLSSFLLIIFAGRARVGT